jgi:hypothetical protein
MWAVLWGLFWVVLGLGVERLTKVAGWLTLILSMTTCTIPGFLLLLGDWGKVPVWAVIAVIVGTVIALIPVTVRSTQGQFATSASGTDVGVAASG